MDLGSMLGPFGSPFWAWWLFAFGNVCAVEVLFDSCWILGAGRGSQGEQPFTLAEVPAVAFSAILFCIRTEGFM